MSMRHVVSRCSLPVIAGLCIGMIGCQPQASKQKSAESQSGAAKKAGSSKKAGKSPPKVTTKDGKKYLDDIPYDVWYDDPLAIVANSATVNAPGNDAAAAAPASTPAATNDAGPARTDPKAAPPAASNDWGAYLAAEQLQEETKRIRNQLKTQLLSQKEYNENFEFVKMNGAVLSALAMMVAQSGEGINWKPNAGYIRDYSVQMFDSAKGLGKPNYDATSGAYENLQSVFSGSIPPGATEPEANKPFADAANRFYLMKRMKLAFDALKLNLNTESKLKSEQEQGLHEGMVLAALSKAIVQESYTSADEAEYQNFAKEMIQQSLAAIQAVKDQEFSKYQDAINVIEKTCNECHIAYRGN